MSITHVQTAAAPKAIGAYSQAVSGDGLLFVSGQLPLDPMRGELVEGGIAEQTQQVLSNVAAILAADGLTWSDVLKSTIYLTDLSNFSTVNDLYQTALDGARPARATVGVATLLRGAQIEIEVVALRR